MKRLILLITFFITVFCACSGEDNTAVSDNVTGEAVSGTAIEHVASECHVPESPFVKGAPEENKDEEANELNPDPDMTVIMTKKDEQMLLERVDSTQKGIEMGDYGLASSPIKGDDGNCYYFRYREEDGRKLTFYRNNSIKVCETVLPKKYKRDWYISEFLKQGEQFWVLFESDEYSEEILVPVQIEDGTWGKGIKTDMYSRYIYYKDCFYSFYGDEGKVDIIDRMGNKKRLKYEQNKKSVTLEAVIDDKLYYITEESDDVAQDYTVMRCNMDGSNKEELFQYGNVPTVNGGVACRLTMDGDYLYLFEPGCGFTLTRIPLYGGEVEKIVKTDWYVLTEDSIYYLDETGRICRVDKDLKNRPEVVTLKGEYTIDDNPIFVCADGHLMVEGCNEEAENIFNKMYDWEVWDLMSDFSMNYSDEYYWVAENGEVEDVIPGTEIKKRYYEWYEFALECDEKYNDDEDDY